MINKLKVAAIALSLAVLMTPRAYSQQSNERDDNEDNGNGRSNIRRVLLISVDGMHALDYENCVKAEHGGFAQDDTNVILLVSNPDFRARTVTSFVETTQVAPTILRALGLRPSDLDAVRQEGTPVLPGLRFK